jgi:hypothetical protein
MFDFPELLYPITGLNRPSVQSRKCAVDLLMGVSPGAFTEEGIWTRGLSQNDA